MKKKLFLSHANIDNKIAERIVEILFIESLGLTNKDIFYTSKRETGIRSSLVWRHQIKENLLDCEIFIALITTNYHKSEMCHAELGAAWATNKKIYPIYLSPITTKNFSVVVAELQADNIRVKEELNSFMEQLTIDFKKSYNKKLNVKGRDLHIQKFLKSLRAYQRKNQSLFDENIKSSEKQDKNKNEISNSTTTSISIELEKLDKNMLKDYSKNKYSEDFSMQEYEIKQQTEAYNELKEILASNEQIPELATIYKRAREQYKNEYDMVVYEIKDQLKSLARLK